MFITGFEKQAQKQVSKVAIFYKDKVLMGIRQDTGKWTEPGGGLKPGEDPAVGALREVKEETGITLKKDDLKHLGTKEVMPKDQTKPILVHAYKCTLEDPPSTDVSKDPDHEVFGWDWIPVKAGKLPDSVAKNKHVPAANNVLNFFGAFEKSAVIKRLLKNKSFTAFIDDVPNQVAQSYPTDFRQDPTARTPDAHRQTPDQAI